MAADTGDIQFFWDRRDTPAARDELRAALAKEKKRRAHDEKNAQELAQAARLESLKHTPAWDELVAILTAQEDRFWRAHIADVRAGKPLDQRELDRAMGKLDGIRAILRAPEKAAAILLRNREQEESE